MRNWILFALSFLFINASPSYAGDEIVCGFSDSVSGAVSDLKSKFTAGAKLSSLSLIRESDSVMIPVLQLPPAARYDAHGELRRTPLTRPAQFVACAIVQN